MRTWHDKNIQSVSIIILNILMHYLQHFHSKNLAKFVVQKFILSGWYVKNFSVILAKYIGKEEIRLYQLLLSHILPATIDFVSDIWSTLSSVFAKKFQQNILYKKTCLFDLIWLTSGKIICQKFLIISTFAKKNLLQSNQIWHI